MPVFAAARAKAERVVILHPLPPVRMEMEMEMGNDDCIV